MNSQITMENRDVRTGRPLVLIGKDVLGPFVETAVGEYRECTPQRPPRCWALLIGRSSAEVIEVDAVVFAGNVRETDPLVLDEFSEVIVPDFGEAYRNGRRGFWCDSADLLAVSRQAENEGRELLGSIHLHPDWHRMGPPRERAMRISHRPTRMDDYVFRNTGWPLNLICYLEQHGGEVFHTIGAWGPTEPEDWTPAALTVLIGTDPD